MCSPAPFNPNHPHTMTPAPDSPAPSATAPNTRRPLWQRRGAKAAAAITTGAALMAGDALAARTDPDALPAWLTLLLIAAALVARGLAELRPSYRLPPIPPPRFD
jgi:hypothetical protein